MDAAELQAWVGRHERRHDHIGATPVAALAATLDRDDPPPGPGSALPPLWHWLYFTPLTPARDLGPDGHARLGGFLPPVPLPRRMWAGSRLAFHRPLRVGEDVTRDSRIVDVGQKTGRSGALVFVTVRHEIADAQGLVLSEEHDIVYRAAPVPAPPAPPVPPDVPSRPAPAAADFEREIVPDPVLLFRYSALTFNGHRIHYDRAYVTGVEGYPGLVVHGPLVATLLLELLRRERPAARVARFEFKALRPLFDIHRFRVCGRVEPGARGVALWACDQEGALAMQARAELG